ncbi:hypothetical protein B484DRAFT_407119 [Ochromonadaceae sp. CCMP2298]|nr:hypothetical protein B484DRAFT_407119 [Ochromonadaceae sp. CCMP2298]
MTKVRYCGCRGGKEVFGVRELGRKYCGKGVNSTYSTGGSFLDRGIALVALSYRTPKTFLNSLRTWRSSGLLDLVSEKVALLNDPLPQEHAMALEHGLCVVQPKDFAHAKMNKPNVFTIGAAFYYALQVIDSE